jgi:hypothetical protein
MVGDGAQLPLLVDVREADDMGREIPRAVYRRFLAVAGGQGTDRRLADLGLERDLDAVRLKPQGELLEAAAGLHPDDLAPRRIVFKPDDLVELASAQQCSAVIDDGRCHRCMNPTGWIGEGKRVSSRTAAWTSA